MNLAIKGHPTRGKEVIEILEMLGGINELDLKGIEADSHYYVGNSINKIYRGLGIYPYDYIIYSLEEFLEKFPYKVGDKVQHKGATSCGSIFEVEEMRWEEILSNIHYVYSDVIINALHYLLNIYNPIKKKLWKKS